MLSGGDLCKTRDLMLISHQSHLRLITTIHKSKLTISTWKKIWIVQPVSGLDKRQCTLQIMTCAKGEQTQIFFFLYTFCTLFLETCSVYFQVMFDQVDSAGRKWDAWWQPTDPRMTWSLQRAFHHTKSQAVLVSNQAREGSWYE